MIFLVMEDEMTKEKQDIVPVAVAQNEVVNDLIHDMGIEIFKPLDEIKIDYADIMLSDVVNLVTDNISGITDALEEFPVVKTLAALTKTGIAIKEYIFCRKFGKFLNEFQSMKHSEKTRQKYLAAVQKNEKWVLKLLENLLQSIDRMDDERKLKITARLFSEYLKENLDWDNFLKYSYVNDRLFLSDIPWLQKCQYNRLVSEKNKAGDVQEDRKPWPEENVDPENGSRLQALGLAEAVYIAVLSGDSQRKFRSTDAGDYFLSLLDDTKME